MTSISNVQQIVAVIRHQIARIERGEPRRPERPAAVRSSTDTHPRRPDLLQLLGQRVRAIDRADPARGRKTFRVFLESVLLAELGESLMNDAQFYRLVDDVQRQMEADETLAASIDAAIEQLLARAS
jgi:hypothetical protein